MITKEEAIQARKEIIDNVIKVSCTWGEGPDVLFALDGKLFMCYEDPIHKDKARHGFITKGSMDLTADQALLLAKRLKGAAEVAKAMDRDLEEYNRQHTSISAIQVSVMKGIIKDYKGQWTDLAAAALSKTAAAIPNMRELTYDQAETIIRYYDMMIRKG